MSTSPALIAAISVSLSAFGTITNFFVTALSSPQYLSFGTNTIWSGLQDLILYGRPENGMLSAKSPDTSLVFLTDAALINEPNSPRHGA